MGSSILTDFNGLSSNLNIVECKLLDTAINSNT